MCRLSPCEMRRVSYQGPRWLGSWFFEVFNLVQLGILEYQSLIRLTGRAAIKLPTKTGFSSSSYNVHPSPLLQFRVSQQPSPVAALWLPGSRIFLMSRVACLFSNFIISWKDACLYRSMSHVLFRYHYHFLDLITFPILLSYSCDSNLTRRNMRGASLHHASWNETVQPRMCLNYF